VSWDRPSAASALADVLEAGTGDLVAVFESPPSSMNAPALVIMRPTVMFHQPAFAVDEITWSVTAAVGVGADDTLDGLIGQARQAVEADPTLGGVVQICRPTEQRPRGIVNIAGADFLTEELILNARM